MLFYLRGFGPSDYFIDTFLRKNVFHINADEEDVFDMVSALIPLLTKWKEIGTALGLRHSALEIIEATDKGGARMCMQGMLVQYVRKSYNCDRFGDPSWMCLCKAIAHPAGGNNEELAQTISKEHPTKGILSILVQSRTVLTL